MNLELVVSPLQKMENINFNYEEIKDGLKKSVEKYEKVIYTPETIKNAKEDRAKLNKLAKALNDEKIRIKKEFMIPYTEFEDKIKEIIGIVTTVVDKVDAQVKKFEQEQREEKKKNILAIYEEHIGEYKELIPLSQIYDTRWENQTYKEIDIINEIENIVSKANSDIEILEKQDPEFMINMKDVYFKTLDLGTALREKERLEAKKQLLKETTIEVKMDAKEITENVIVASKELEEQKPIQEEIVELVFKVTCSASKLRGLQEYMNNNEIKYGRYE